MKQTSLFAVTALSIALSACGGSGSSGESESIPSLGTSSSLLASINVNKSPVAINTSNAKQVAALTYIATSNLEGLNETDDFVGSEDTSDSFMRLALDKVNALTTIAGVSTRANTPFKLPCESGNMEITSDDANGDGEMDPGDVTTIQFNSCMYVIDGVASQSDGTMRTTLHSINDARTSYTATSTYSEVTFSTPDHADLINGSLNIEVNTTSADASVVITGKEVSIIINATEANILSDYRVSNAQQFSDQSWVQSLSATMASSLFDGSVVLTTLSDLQGSGSYPPVFGELKVSGANDTYVLLNADTGDIETLAITVFDGASTTTDEVYWSDLNTD